MIAVTSRLTGTMTALLLTAALFLSMPGIAGLMRAVDTNRMDESLRPPRMRTLTVWLMPGEMGDRRVITRLIADYERQNPGLRVFLRTADAQELAGEDAVLPDAVLFENGQITTPEAFFLPLAGPSESSGMYGGVCYACPLWLDVNVLCLPAAWLETSAPPVPAPRSLLAASTPAPEPGASALLTADDLPWERLIQPGAVAMPQGVALQQLLCMCPYPLRQQLVQGMAAGAAEEAAQVQTLRAYLSAEGKGAETIACLMTPAVSDAVRYAALCRDGEEARGFLRFLADQSAQEASDAHFWPLAGGVSSGGLMGEADLQFSRSHTLPNAFAQTREGLQSLCQNAFLRNADPVETLLQLR